MAAPRDRYGPQIFLVLLALVGFVALVGGVSHLDDTPGSRAPKPTPAPSFLGQARPGQALAGTRFTVQTKDFRITPVSTAVPSSKARCSSATESI